MHYDSDQQSYKLYIQNHFSLMSDTLKGKPSQNDSQNAYDNLVHAGSTKSSQDGSMGQSAREENDGDNISEKMIFYEEFRRLIAIGFQVRVQNRFLMQEGQKMMKKIDRIQHQIYFPEEASYVKNNQEARSRRPASQIQRNFQCSVENCSKKYGREGSLLNHIKLKHPQIYHSKLH